MIATIVREDNMVGIDGLFFDISCDSLPSNLHAVQWQDTIGEVEWTDEDDTTINDMTAYQFILDDWQTKKDFDEARALDPFHGMEGEELFDAQKAASEATIRETFVTDSTAPVESNGGTFNGGEPSAFSINGAHDLAVELGELHVLLTDINNVSATYTFTQTKSIASDIALAYRTAFFVKQVALTDLSTTTYGG